MDFEELKNIIRTESNNEDSFEESTEKIKKIIFSSTKVEIIEIISQIGVIPETISHDSSEEKLFAKVADIVLARAFSELGIKADAIRERSNCADVKGKSEIHGYTLVGDAKAFRLSRTAKNQKDFKVKSMNDWRGDDDYSVLVCPYFQYPKSNSQIFGQALDGNVCLFSWEQMQFLLENDIKETPDISLKNIWNMSEILRKDIVIANKNLRDNFSNKGIDIFCETTGTSREEWKNKLNTSKGLIIDRGEQEIEFWKNCIENIKQFPKEKAISELIVALKLNEKISAIDKYITSLKN